MKKKVFMILLFSAPILFFFGYRLLQTIIGSDSQESLTAEIIGSIMCGYLGSYGIWNLYKKVNKQKNNTTRQGETLRVESHGGALTP
jgi:hypothetical protein